MAIQTFSPPRPPGYQSSQSVNYKTKEAQFGDNYIQRAADGINNEQTVWQLVWNALKPSEYSTIATFLDARKGFEAFYYTVPGDVQRKYRCKTWSRNLSSPGANSLQATFEEVFDP